MRSSETDPPSRPAPHPLADETVATVRRWLDTVRDSKAGKGAGFAARIRHGLRSMRGAPAAERLAELLHDPRGLEFAIGFVDTVTRPEDLGVAARNLERLSRSTPRTLPWYLRAAILIGGGFAPLLPWPIVPIARQALRRMVGHLVIDATPQRLGRSLERLRADGIRLNLNLLGEAVLGDDEADRRLAGTRDLLMRDDVDTVSIKVSSVVSQASMWAFDELADRIVERLTPLYELAAASRTFINLDMEAYQDLDLTITVFQRILDQPHLRDLQAGIALQAYLPDALEALQGLTEWATVRRGAGGAGIRVRVVKGANLPMERVDAVMHGWPLAAWDSKRATDAHYKRVLDWALTPERTDAVRIGVASHNLFDVAFAWLLARERGVDSRVEFEMLHGMASAQADAVRADVGSLILYTPVVHPREFDAAIAYLVRRLEENASSEHFLSAMFALHDPAVFQRERTRFLDSLEWLDRSVPPPNRTQDRDEPALPDDTAGFRNEPDTDPSLGVNRAWGRRVLARSTQSRLGVDTIQTARVDDLAQLERIMGATAQAGESWGRRPVGARAQVLRDAADVLVALRGRLIEVMASETGKTIAEGDTEVSEAVDFARFYAERALELDRVDGAGFQPSRLTVVAPPWNFPVSIPAGSVLAALAAGSGVILKPAAAAQRCGAVLAQALWEAGVPRDVLALVQVSSQPLRERLIAGPEVDRVVLTGGIETAQRFRALRPDLPLLAETSGKNAIVVTPSADLDLAVADILTSAFGHAGQKCSAASLVILVGSVARSERFRRQLLDAARTLRVGYPQDPRSVMGPIIRPPSGKLLRALTSLDDGEQWMLEPRQLDESRRLWSPGIKEGVAPGSEFHRTEVFGPVLGIMTARTLDEAIAQQNSVDFGLTAGIHSLDPDEVSHWLDTVEAGNLYVNRGITGAIVGRQPFGGWKRSAVGPGAKAGGPNSLLVLGSWDAVEAAPEGHIRLDGMTDRVATVIKRAQSGMGFEEFDRVRRAARSDQAAWDAEFGVSRDRTGLGVERNVLRYRPTGVALRLSEGEPMGHLVRLFAAASRAGAPVHVSSALPLPTRLSDAFAELAAPIDVRSVTIESDSRWLARVRADGVPAARVRLVGGDARALAEALGGSVDVAVWSGPVTTAGRIELLPFLREQSVSITAHRFGSPDRGMLALPL